MNKIKWFLTVSFIIGANFFSFCQIIDESFEGDCNSTNNSFYELCYENWSSSHGSPNYAEGVNGWPAAEGNRMAFIGVNYKGACQAPDRGEGIILYYQFHANKCYTFSYWIRSGGTIGSSKWILTQGLPNLGGTLTTNCFPAEIIPAIPPNSEVVAGTSETDLNYGEWKQVVVEFTPILNHSQLWFRNSNDPGTGAMTEITSYLTIDDVQLWENCGCQTSAPIINEPIVGNGQTILNWDAVPNAISYSIDINIGDDACGCTDMGNSKFHTTEETSLVLAGSISSKCFSYTVTAICANGNSISSMVCFEPSCTPEVDFSLPDNSCFGNPLILTNNSQNYDAYKIQICRIDADGNCIGNTVSSGDWINGALPSIDIEAAYEEWRGQKMWCGLSTGGSRLYKVILLLKNECGEASANKEVLITCAPEVDVKFPDEVCEGEEIPLEYDNSKYYVEYKINIRRVIEDGITSHPRANFVSSGFIEGQLDDHDIDLERDYQIWAKIYRDNPENKWKLWCGKLDGTYARYEIAIALRDECGRTSWQTQLITVMCEPCDPECFFAINAGDCRSIPPENNRPQYGEEDGCRACYFLSGPGVSYGCAISWEVATDVNPFFTKLPFNSLVGSLKNSNYPGATTYTIRVTVSNCGDDPVCNAVQVQTFYEICGVEEYKEDGNDDELKPRSVASNFNISINPNPVSDFLKVQYDIQKESEMAYTLYDLNGKQLITSNESKVMKAGNHSFHLDTRQLNSGIYFLKLRIGQNLKTTKIIKIN